MEDFILHNHHIGPKIKDIIKATKETEEKGSIITIVATDIPLSYRQLKRVIKRAYSGISKTGSFTGNGSGEIVIGFSTANIVKHYEEKDTLDIKVINENKIDQIFKAVSEATEESILNSLICSNTTIGRDGHKIYSLKDFIDCILPLFQ